MKKFLLLILIIVALSVYQMRGWMMENGPLEKTTEVVIPRGAGVGIVAGRLEQAGVITHGWLFKLAARIQGLDKKLRAGEYQFEPQISMSEVMWKIALGDILYRRVTLPEGLTTKQMLDIVKADEVLEGDVTINPAEGELLPETYSYIKGDSRDSIVMQAQKAMQKLKTEAWENRVEGLPLKNPEEMMVLASIIEKETGVIEERGLVASVFVNRLKIGMRLQTDPTVIYAITKGQYELERSLTRKDLALDNSYNTYKYYGLPPTPICNPGRASVEAAVNPEISNFLYFVATGNGGHNFSRSLNEHNTNVQQWKKSIKK